jgi:hypothetical protein
VVQRTRIRRRQDLLSTAGPGHVASCEHSQRGDRGVGLAEVRGADPFAELR